MTGADRIIPHILNMHLGQEASRISDPEFAFMSAVVNRPAYGLLGIALDGHEPLDSEFKTPLHDIHVFQYYLYVFKSNLRGNVGSMATLIFLPGTLTGPSPCIHARSALILAGVGKGCNLSSSMQNALPELLNGLSETVCWRELSIALIFWLPCSVFWRSCELTLPEDLLPSLFLR